MAYLELASSFYDRISNETDERIKDWPLIGSPVPGTLLILAYISFVVLGPRWMAKRQPLQLKPVIMAYNFVMVIFSAFTAYEMIMGSYETNFSLSCNWSTDYSNSPSAIRMAGAIWFFFIAKFVELLDTVFFILRKKHSQVTILHVFHHGCLPMFWWWGVKAVPGGHGSFHATVNCCVHVVMYLYYFIASLGPKYQKYLWWKRYVTMFQLAQFFIVTLHNSQYLFIDCAFPWKFVFAIQGFTTIVALLFLNFYTKTYRKSKTETEKQAKHTSNGYVKNGFESSNGHATSNNGQASTNGYYLRRRKVID